MSQVQPSAALAGIWDRIRNTSDSDCSWVICNFKKKKKRNPKKQRLVSVCHGPGGIEDAMTVLKDDEIAFIGFRVTGLDEREADVRVGVAAQAASQGAGKKTVCSTRCKLAFVFWSGPKVPSMTKAKLAGYVTDVKDYFAGVSLSLRAHERSDVSIEDLEKQFRAAAGAHQVKRYDFRNNYTGAIGSGIQYDVESAADAKAALTPSKLEHNLIRRKSLKELDAKGIIDKSDPGVKVALDAQDDEKPVPMDRATKIVGDLETKYNAGDFAGASEAFSAMPFVTVNGGVDAGGLATCKTRESVADFLEKFSSMGGSNLKLQVTTVEGNVSVHTWTADNASGESTARWGVTEDGRWEIVSDEITMNVGPPAAP
jgi:hypothetical protein